MSQSKQEKKPSMTLTQAIATGSIAGAVEVCTTGQILWSLKTQVQSKKPISFNPWELARGMPLNVISMVPITALQVGCNQVIHQVCFHGAPSSDFQRMTTAFSAGAVAAGIAGPTEMVMSHLKKGDRFASAPAQFVKQYGIRALYTGLMGSAIRDGFFSSAYLAGTPTLKKCFEGYSEDKQYASIAANLTSGVLATILSHPFDTIKSRQQLKAPSSHARFMAVAKEIYAEKGIPGFFSAALWRGFRVVAAVPIMGFVTNELEEQFGQLNLKVEKR